MTSWNLYHSLRNSDSMCCQPWCFSFVSKPITIIMLCLQGWGSWQAWTAQIKFLRGVNAETGIKFQWFSTLFWNISVNTQFSPDWSVFSYVARPRTDTSRCGRWSNASDRTPHTRGTGDHSLAPPPTFTALRHFCTVHLWLVMGGSVFCPQIFVFGVVEQNGLDAYSRDPNLGTVQWHISIMISKLYNQ